MSKVTHIGPKLSPQLAQFAPSGQPRPEVIAAPAQHLEKANAGNVQAFALAPVYADGSYTPGHAPIVPVETMNSLLASASLLQNYLCSHAFQLSSERYYGVPTEPKKP